MAFAMSLPKHKRIKFYQPDGSEVFEEEDRWTIVRAVHSAPQEDAGAGDEEAAEPKSSTRAPAQPLEALEKLHMARGEVSMALDLIEMLEAQQFLGIASVPPRETPPAAAARARQIRLQATARQLQAAGQQLKQGAAALRAHLRVEDRFFGEVAQLAGDWLVLQTAEFTFSSGAAPYRAQLQPQTAGSGAAWEAAEAAEPPAEAGLELARGADGNVQAAAPEGGLARGAAAVGAVLAQRHREVLWEGLRAALDQEAVAASGGLAAQRLASELLCAGRSSASLEIRELAALLLKAHLASLDADPAADGAAQAPQLLPAANAWLRHRCFARALWRSLRAQAAALRTEGLEVSLEAVPLPGPARSAVRLLLRRQGSAHASAQERSMLLVLRADSLEVRGAAPLPGQRWAAGASVFAVKPQETGGLLRRLAQ